MLLQEPLLIVTAFYLLFVVVIIYVRMDFAISKVSCFTNYLYIQGWFHLHILSTVTIPRGMVNPELFLKPDSVILRVQRT